MIFLYKSKSEIKKQATIYVMSGGEKKNQSILGIQRIMCVLSTHI